MKILIVNAGSSSLKYQLVDMTNETLIAKGLVERINIEGSHLNQKTPDGKVTDIYQPIKDHVEATQLMLAALQDPEKGVIKSVDEIGAVGHRVLHGGEEFTASCIITEEVKACIRKFIPLGPLHNPANLMGIEACEAVMPTTPQVAVFDTAFHQTMPPKAFMYGVPYKYYKELGVRRYGFHGTSHRYVSKRVCEFLGVDPVGKKIIIAHLGNGSSLSAVVDGKCVDTSMGITPLEGVVMGTRSGSCDPAVVQFIANNANMDVNEVLDMMNKKSGLLGISELSSDMRDIDAAADSGNEKAALARDMLVYGIKKYIGSYAAAMGGVDIIAFTAGIGENGPELREAVMKDMEFLGAKIDPAKNNVKGKETIISTDDSKVTVCVIPTNEEIMIARDTRDLVANK
ncbi:MAG: acetate kinase [Christensenellaceae bacterium]|nr:acetate kinase [Christensenellaceae bacterium]